ncbi:MAG: hypothetical protein K2M11_07155, partial [Paramuribaculum sp.]|nr:hypothetical protein [Paramuribaculum sp.]
MAEKGFTSGERRGLIVLLAGMCVIIAWVLMSKTCGSNEPKTIPTAAVAAHDSIVMHRDSNASVAKVISNIKKKSGRKVSRRPDGKKRDYLAE